MNDETSAPKMESVDITELSDEELETFVGGAFAEGSAPVVLRMFC